MQSTDELLSELKDLTTATNIRPTPTPAPSSVVLEEDVGADADFDTDDEEFEKNFEYLPEDYADEKTLKVLALIDLTVSEFDSMIGSLGTVKSALEALREEFSSSAPYGAVEAVVAPVSAAAAPLESPRIEEYNAQGSPNAMGDIDLVIPPSVPLPNED